jgi:hypothetical protein
MRKFEFDYLICIRARREKEWEMCLNYGNNGCHFVSDKKSRKQRSEKVWSYDGIKEERLSKNMFLWPQQDRRKRRRAYIWKNHINSVSVVMKSTVFWYIRPYSPLSQPTFWRNMSPQLHCRVNRARYQHKNRWQGEAGVTLPPTFTLVFSLLIRPWRWRLNIPPKRRLTFNWLHCFIS